MQAALLRETVPRTSYCSRKTQVIGSLAFSMLLGVGVAMVLLSPMQQPNIDMASATPNYVGRAMGRIMGAVPRNTPMWLGGSANQQRQPLAAFKLRGLNNMVSARPMVSVRATTESEAPEAMQRLQYALKLAEECVGECAVEWDNVEELSAAVEDSGEPKKVDTTFSKEDVSAIKATMAKLAAAREETEKKTTSVKEVDEKMVNEITSAVKAIKDVGAKVSPDRIAKIDAALQEALRAAKACTGDECATAWETVEELSEAKNS